MGFEVFPTAFLFLIGGLILPLIPKGPIRGMYMLLIPALAALMANLDHAAWGCIMRKCRCSGSNWN